MGRRASGVNAGSGRRGGRGRAATDGRHWGRGPRLKMWAGRGRRSYACTASYVPPTLPCVPTLKAAPRHARRVCAGAGRMASGAAMKWASARKWHAPPQSTCEVNRLNRRIEDRPIKIAVRPVRPFFLVFDSALRPGLGDDSGVPASACLILQSGCSDPLFPWHGQLIVTPWSDWSQCLPAG